MPNKMLIDSSHPEETRVVVVRGNRIEEFDFESQDKKQLKGNIYLARVTRVEPSLQAAFVEYGGNRHGFLAFAEIHPDYYQIPMADRQALLKAEADAADEDEDEEDEERGRNRRRRRGRGRNRDEGRQREASGQAGDGEPQPEEGAPGAQPVEAVAAAVDVDAVSEEITEISPAETEFAASEGLVPDMSESSEDGDDDGDSNGIAEEDEVESVGAEDALEELPSRRKHMRRQYKIQEVIKRRQILLVQVVKEERGNKGAALTTYLSLAGRYSVLMPNTARGGGISRKITSAQDRKRLKEVVSDLEVPQGMGVILRTAGANRTKAEIKRDYEYLMRLWENVRTLTLESIAPALVYEEGSLIKRSVRDLYNKDIDEILVAGEDGYREAKDFMRMLMPSHAKVVQPYREITPIFARSGIEAQLDKMLQPQVTLKSGGYIIINQTEALVAIDVNSGRSTKEHSIEDTALQTNLEAAEEVARQLRLRDMAGLIVIDFIDMEEKRNNRAVEKKLKDCLKNDRARIQVGRISHFGLLEMSRQRIRASVLESTMKPCPHCGGTGHVRSDSSVALHVVRAIEEFLLKDARNHISVRTPVATALYVLNHKRHTIVELEERFQLSITIEADDTIGAQHYQISRGLPVEKPVVIAPPSIADIVEDEDEPEIVEVDEAEEAPAEARRDDEGDERGGRKRRRRRRRRGGRDRDEAPRAGEAGDQPHHEDGDGDEDDLSADDGTEKPEAKGAEATQDEADKRKRRRGKRGGRRNRRDEDGAEAGAESEVGEADATDEGAVAAAEETAPIAPDHEPPAEPTAEVETVETAQEPSAAVEAAEKPKRVRKPRKKAAAAPADDAVAEAVETGEAPATETPAVSEEVPQAPEEPKRRSRRRSAAPAEAEAATAPEPVVVTSAPEATPEAEADAEVEDKPRKAGWWQRRGFFGS